MPVDVQVTGLREIQQRLQQISDTVGGKQAAKPVVHALRQAGKLIQTSAINLVHKKSGTLAANIIVTHPKTKVQGRETIIVTIRAKAKKYKDTARNRRTGKVGGKYKDYGPLFYARFLEFGTSHQPPYPFMRPAFEFNKSDLPETVADSLRNSLDKLEAPK
jgi:HK97 gp10 family phage protein